ncbi:hypothetical protein [Burkholderia sp. PU8-34]
MQIDRVPLNPVMLEDAGHHPLEQAGPGRMIQPVYAFCVDAAREA